MCVCVHMCHCVCAHMHACLCTLCVYFGCTYIYVYAYVHMLETTQINKIKHKYTYVRTHMHAHTNTHTYVHVLTQVYLCMFKRSYNKLPKIFITYKHQPTFTPFFSLCICIIFIEVLMSGFSLLSVLFAKNTV